MRPGRPRTDRSLVPLSVCTHATDGSEWLHPAWATYYRASYIRTVLTDRARAGSVKLASPLTAGAPSADFSAGFGRYRTAYLDGAFATVDRREQPALEDMPAGQPPRALS